MRKLDAVNPEALTSALFLTEGELVTMDFGPSKLDSQLLLDYGVLDVARPQARITVSVRVKAPNEAGSGSG